MAKPPAAPERTVFLHLEDAAHLATEIAQACHRAIDINGEPARLSHALTGVDASEFACRVVAAWSGTRVGILEPPR